MTTVIRNPILRGFNPDPSIVRVGEDYFIATSTFEWFPGVQIHHSRDLVHWRLLTRPLSRAAQLNMIGDPDSCGIWAPCLTHADGHAERVAALHMIEPRADRPTAITLGADKAYDAEDFVNELRSMNVIPHVAQNTSGRSSAIDGRTTRHGGYAVSQRIRKRIEEAFGWIKTIAGQDKSRFRGRDRVGWAFTFAAAAYNLVRLPKLIAEAG